MFELETYEIVNILGLIIGLAFGMIAQKNQFCFSGSIKDYVLIKSTKKRCISYYGNDCCNYLYKFNG